MTRDDMWQLKQGDILIDFDGGRWVVTDFTTSGTHRMPTVVRTMVITFPNPWRKFESPTATQTAKSQNGEDANIG